MGPVWYILECSGTRYKIQDAGMLMPAALTLMLMPITSPKQASMNILLFGDGKNA
jgi:hypothetical protein